MTRGSRLLRALEVFGQIAALSNGEWPGEGLEVIDGGPLRFHGHGAGRLNEVLTERADTRRQ